MTRKRNQRLQTTPATDDARGIEGRSSTSPSTACSHGVASARGFDGYSDDHGQVVLSDRRARSPVAPSA